jgi:hypothetical protein
MKLLLSYVAVAHRGPMRRVGGALDREAESGNRPETGNFLPYR